MQGLCCFWRVCFPPQMKSPRQPSLWGDFLQPTQPQPKVKSAVQAAAMHARHSRFWSDAGNRLTDLPGAVAHPSDALVQLYSPQTPEAYSTTQPLQQSVQADAIPRHFPALPHHLLESTGDHQHKSTKLFPLHQWRRLALPQGCRQRHASLEFLRRTTRHCSAPRGLPTHIRTSRFLSWGTAGPQSLRPSCLIIDFLNPSPISLAPWSGKTVDLPFKETLKWLPLPVWNSTPWAFNHRRNSLYFMCITRCFGRANVQHICYACNITVAPHIWKIASPATTWPRLRATLPHATVKPVAANSATGPENPRKMQAHKRPNPRLPAFFCACISVQWRLCVGGLRACRVPVSPVSQPAHSCHPFA